MLLRFAVANHLSIREKQELSFAASSLRDRSDGLIDCKAVPSGSVLPAIVIYGANASGKSNLVNAIAAMRKMVLRSHTHGEPGGGVPRDAFKLDSTCSQTPSKFEIDFVIDEVRYHYGFETTDEVFVVEWLYAFPGAHRRRMFERDNSEFNFGRWLKGQNNNIAKLTRPNSLFLSAAAQNGHEQLSKIYEYFRSVRTTSIQDGAASARFTRDDPDKRVIDFLTLINTGVIGYRKREHDMPEFQEVIREVLASVKASFNKVSDAAIKIEPAKHDRHVEIELAHRGQQGEPFYLGLESESAGTRRLLTVLGLAYQALDKGALLCIDEVDTSLHTYASEAVVKLFCRPDINRNGAQLIATTHDTNLMNSSALRRDQLWFIEKTPEGATELYPLTDIRTRKGDNIELGYLQGRFGALPSDDIPLPLHESN
ncbi:MAG: ATP-binding protein [Gammaproteobacteria bacterium]|nr:ATP-binding protein [Gammaproteobacteria bacterium]